MITVPAPVPSAGHRRRIVAAVLAAIGIFVIDTATMLQSAVAVLYALVLVIADDGSSRRSILELSVLSAALAVFSFLLNHHLEGEAQPILRLLVSLAAIGITAALVIRNQAVRDAARANDVRYRTIFDTLAVAIWEHDLRAVRRAIDAVRAAGIVDLRAHLSANPQLVNEMRRMVRITDANDTALRLLEVASKEAFFSHLADFLPEEDESFLECILAIDEGRRVFESETQVRTTTGKLVDILVVLSFPPGAGLDRICGSILDLTERKRDRAALERTRSDLDRAIRAGIIAELSASIAHEVSQPLSAIRSFVDAARRWLSRTPPQLDEAVAALDQAARAAVSAGEVVERVRHLIGTAAPDRSPVDMDALVRSAMEFAQGELAGVRIDLDLDSGGRAVLGDPILLQQLLIALFAHALRQMEQLELPLRRLAVQSRSEARSIVLLVANTGAALPPAPADEAFRPLSSIRDDGVGIGLAMCRSIVEAHGGVLDVRRGAQGNGSEVEIRLPQAA